MPEPTGIVPLPIPAARDARPDLLLLMAAPRGFCAGVRRAIDAVREALKVHGPPVYVRRPIVHNLAVVRALEAEGAVFVEELDAVPEGAVVILSAHGVAPRIMAEAMERRLTAYDAVCPLVAKVHREVDRFHEAGRRIILVGHEGHPEIEGTLGRVPEDAAATIASARDAAELGIDRDAPVGVAVQTTYSVEEAAAVLDVLRGRFSDLAEPAASDICYATTNRQQAIRAIAGEVDAVIVVGEAFSSNACRLAEVAAASCPSVQLIAVADEIDWAALPDTGAIGLTAAASTPESSVAQVVAALAARYRLRVEEVGSTVENAVFKPVPIG